MAYKLIALDLDDTLLNSRRKLTPRVIDVVRKAVQKDKHVVIATGRSFVSLKIFYDEIGLSTPAISFGGAIVVDKDGNKLFFKPVPGDLAKKVLQFAGDNKIHAQVYFGDEYYFTKHTSHADLYAEAYGFPGKEMPDLLEKEEILTPKILFVDEKDKILELQEELRKLFPRLSVCRSKPNYLEINNPLANKGVALEFLGEYMGLKREELIAVGDSQIDSSMIKYAGLGVAVENAIEEVRNIADYVTSSNDEDGVAKVIEKFLLED